MSQGNARGLDVNSVSTATQVEVDFGALPVDSMVFTITNPDITPTMRIVAAIAYEAPTGKDLDEIEMDRIDIVCSAGTGQFQMLVRGEEGYLSGNFKINYTY